MLRILSLTLALNVFGSVSAATYVVGAPITARVTHSSTGSACDSDCWEIWKISGIGSFMVVKDGDGYITEAGQTSYSQELSDRFSAALVDRETGVYTGADESGLKLPASPAIYRYGLVTTTTNGAACSSNCTIGAFFGTPIVFVTGYQSLAEVVTNSPSLDYAASR